VNKFYASDPTLLKNRLWWSGWLSKKALPEVDAKNIFTDVIYDITTLRIMPNSIMILSIIDIL
jgi:hypothetical protein